MRASIVTALWTGAVILLGLGFHHFLDREGPEAFLPHGVLSVLLMYALAGVNALVVGVWIFAMSARRLRTRSTRRWSKGLGVAVIAAALSASATVAVAYGLDRHVAAYYSAPQGR